MDYISENIRKICTLDLGKSTSIIEYDDIKDVYCLYNEEKIAHEECEYNDDYLLLEPTIKFIKKQLESDKFYLFKINLYNEELRDIIDFKIINENGDNILTHLCKSKDLYADENILKFIIENININHKNNDNKTALILYYNKYHKLCINFNDDILQLLIEKSDMSIRDENKLFFITILETYFRHSVANTNFLFNPLINLNNDIKREILFGINNTKNPHNNYNKEFLLEDLIGRLIMITNLSGLDISQLQLNDVELLKLKLSQEIDKNKELLKLKKFDIGTTLGNVISKYF